MRFPRWRAMTWAIVIWCVLIVAWAIAGGGSAASNCANQTHPYLTQQEATNACEAGAGIGVALILFIGFIGFVFLSLIWIMSRKPQVQVYVQAPEVPGGWATGAPRPHA